MNSTVRIGILASAWGCGCLFLGCGKAHRLGGEEAEPGISIGGSSAGSTSEGSGGATPPGGKQPAPPPIWEDYVFETTTKPDDCELPGGWEQATTLDGAIDFEPMEVFTGYVVDPRWPLPEDEELVTLYVESRTETTISGAIKFGDGALPAPATDPLRGYMPPEIYALEGEELLEATWVLPELWSGHALSLRDGAVEGARIRFAAHPAEQWRTWCELVPAYPDGHCVPGNNDGIGTLGWMCDEAESSCMYGCDAGGIVYDCLKYELCRGDSICSCEGCGCTASTASQEIALDLRLEENGELNGAIITEREGSWQVYLTLDANCSPPYTIDDQDVKQYKPECL